jgi:hypothetical protein
MLYKDKKIGSIKPLIGIYRARDILSNRAIT